MFGFRGFMRLLYSFHIPLMAPGANTTSVLNEGMASKRQTLISKEKRMKHISYKSVLLLAWGIVANVDLIVQSSQKLCENGRNCIENSTSSGQRTCSDSNF